MLPKAAAWGGRSRRDLQAVCRACVCVGGRSGHKAEHYEWPMMNLTKRNLFARHDHQPAVPIHSGIPGKELGLTKSCTPPERITTSNAGSEKARNQTCQISSHCTPQPTGSCSNPFKCLQLVLKLLLCCTQPFSQFDTSNTSNIHHSPTAACPAARRIILATRKAAVPVPPAVLRVLQRHTGALCCVYP